MQISVEEFSDDGCVTCTMACSFKSFQIRPCDVARPAEAGRQPDHTMACLVFVEWQPAGLTWP